MSLALLNASNPTNVSLEADVYVDYRDGVEACFDGEKILKKCNSWHSLPCAMRGEFFVYNKPGWQGAFRYDKVIVLVNRDLEKVFPLIKQLKMDKTRKVLVGFHESADDFFQQASPYHNREQNWLATLKKLVSEADGFCNVMISYRDWFEWFFEKPVLTTYHAAPYYEWDHGLTVPFEEREGIMVGTRTFNQRLRRNTLQALGVALQVAEKQKTFVTWVCEEPIINKEELQKMFDFPLKGGSLAFIKGPLSYVDWLKTIAKHRVLFHYDYSSTLGQLAMDATLVDVPCVGGNSDNNNLLQTTSEYNPLHNQYLLEDAISIMNWEPDFDFMKRFTSFKAVRKNIEKFFKRLNE